MSFFKNLFASVASSNSKASATAGCGKCGYCQNGRSSECPNMADKDQGLSPNQKLIISMNQKREDVLKEKKEAEAKAKATAERLQLNLELAKRLAVDIDHAEKQRKRWEEEAKKVEEALQPTFGMSFEEQQVFLLELVNNPTLTPAPKPTPTPTPAPTPVAPAPAPKQEVVAKPPAPNMELKASLKAAGLKDKEVDKALVANATTCLGYGVAVRDAMVKHGWRTEVWSKWQPPTPTPAVQPDLAAVAVTKGDGTLATSPNPDAQVWVPEEYWG